ncbi:MAG: flagellar motor switch protein FliG [Acidobacteria bacterium]|nr:MAG: flagellar motor switch protein FliG [Acidobacteriota bacterium]
MPEELSGATKAAIVLSLIGEEAAAKVLEHLDKKEVRRVTMEIAGIEMIDATRYESVLEEFRQMLEQSRGLELAGPPLARRLLAKACPDDADRIMGEIAPRRRVDDEDGPPPPPPELPEVVVRAPVRRLAMLLADEPPQTVALVLALLPPRKAARLLAMMNREQRIEVTRRMASMNEVRSEVVARVGEVLSQRLDELCDEPLVPLDGIQTAADRLTNLGRANGQEIVEALSEGFPELATQLRDILFTFDMLRGLGDRDAQEVLKQVDRSTLALALKGADPELHAIFFRNMSERAGQMLKEEMEFLGAPKLADIEKAQRTIIDLVLKLEKEGTISLEEQAVVAG